jgi:hypothetical protein
MKRLTLPKNPHKRLKIFAILVNEIILNANISIISIIELEPQTRNNKGIKSKVLVAVEYKEAVIEAINFEKN